MYAVRDSTCAALWNGILIDLGPFGRPWESLCGLLARCFGACWTLLDALGRSWPLLGHSWAALRGLLGPQVLPKRPPRARPRVPGGAPGVPRDTRGVPKGSQRVPKGSPRGPKGSPRGPQGVPKGSPRGPQRVQRSLQKLPKGSPRVR